MKKTAHRRYLLTGVIATAGIASAALISSAQAAPAQPVAPQPAIIKYQFTYNRAGTLIAVTTQDVRHHITSFPCSPPAIASNGNYSVSCDK